MRYRESSKIVRLATLEHGLQSAIARGALRPRSRFQAAIQVLSEGTAQYYSKEGRELHTLAEFEASRVRVGLVRQVRRFAAASAMAELILRTGSADRHTESWHALKSGLDALEDAETRELEPVALAAIWELVAVLGFSPELSLCARDGRPLDTREPVPFSLTDGGALCPGCGRHNATTTLPPDALDQLKRLVNGETEGLTISQPNASAHRRLLARFVEVHLAEGRAMPAMEFWSAAEQARP